MRSEETTAVLLAVLLQRSGETRARVSGKTIRRISQRRQLRSAFMSRLTPHLDDLGLSLSELERGGYGLIRTSVLEGAKTITAKHYISADLKKLKKDPAHLQELLRELGDEDSDGDEDE